MTTTIFTDTITGTTLLPAAQPARRRRIAASWRPTSVSMFACAELVSYATSDDMGNGHKSAHTHGSRRSLEPSP